MVVGTQMEPHPATILHAPVAKVSTWGYVGCPHKRQWATGKCTGGGGGAGGNSLGAVHYQTGAAGR